MEQLIVFTRYPEPGKTKTRLIPALGAEGAAKLQQEMTENTLAAASILQHQRGTHIEVYFTGGTAAQMSAWLGEKLRYRPQSEGDLGDRLTKAFATAFAAEMERVAAIGIDCPDLDATLLTRAFSLLETADLVLGPAVDGGYYLIGMSRFVPELFVGIAWSTATVLEETRAIAQRLGLAIAYLPQLNDVDRPEDLPR